MKLIGFAFETLAATVSTAALVITASVSPAATLTIDPDAGVFVTGPGSSSSLVSLNGVFYCAGDLTDSNTVREIQAYGNMNLNAGDVIQAVAGSTTAVRFIVGGNVNIARVQSCNLARGAIRLAPAAAGRRRLAGLVETREQMYSPCIFQPEDCPETLAEAACWVPTALRAGLVWQARTRERSLLLPSATISASAATTH